MNECSWGEISYHLLTIAVASSLSLSLSSLVVTRVLNRLSLCTISSPLDLELVKLHLGQQQSASIVMNAVLANSSHRDRCT